MSSSSSPDSDSSGSKEGSSDSKEPKKPRKPEESSAAVPVVSLEASTESGLSSAGTTLKPMDIAKAERIKYLEETTRNKDSDLRSLAKDITLLVNKRQALLDKTEELTSQNYVPFLSPMAYSNYIKDYLHSEDPFSALLAKNLHHIISVQSFFSSQGFEMIAYTREVLMSVIRNKFESSPETVKSLLRGFGLYSLQNELLNIPLESSTCFDIHKFLQVGDHAFCNKPNIYVPESSKNPGFDYFIRFPTADKSYLNVVYEMKYSDPTSIKPANLNKSMILDKHNKCKEIFGDKFVFIVFGWRETTTSLCRSHCHWEACRC